MTNEEEHTVLDMPDTSHEVVRSLMEIIYNGSIEASLEQIRALLTLAHSLYITVPVSDQLVSMLGLQLPPQTALPQPGGQTKPVASSGLELPGLNGLSAMSMWQQQILGQYAMINGLLGQQQAPSLHESASKLTSKTASDISCPLCGVSLPTVIDMRQHMATHEQNKELMSRLQVI